VALQSGRGDAPFSSQRVSLIEGTRLNQIRPVIKRDLHRPRVVLAVV